MGNVPSTHIFIGNLCGAGYEMGLPEDAHMIGFGAILVSPWSLSCLMPEKGEML